MACPACGASNDDGARFCRRCGASLDADATTRIDPTSVTRVMSGRPADADTGEMAVVTAAPPESEVRTCPACEATNSGRRLICGRCGADLDTGAPTVREVPPVTDGPSPRPAAHRDGPSVRARTGAAIATAGLLIGAGIGAMVPLGLGPFAPDPEGPPSATFRTASYDTPVRISGEQVGASSVNDPTADRRFDPPLMLDGNLTTAWASSGDTRPGGVDERIVVEFPQPVWLTSITFGNGDQLTDRTFASKARVARVVVRFDAGQSITVDLRDEPDLQAVRLPDPILTTGLFLDIVEVHPGTSDPDVALSELAFQGHVADADDRRVAAARKPFPRVRRSES